MFFTMQQLCTRNTDVREGIRPRQYAIHFLNVLRKLLIPFIATAHTLQCLQRTSCDFFFCCCLFVCLFVCLQLHHELRTTNARYSIILIREVRKSFTHIKSKIETCNFSVDESIKYKKYHVYHKIYEGALRSIPLL